MRSSTITFWRDLALLALLGLIGGALLLLPTEQLREEPRPLVALESNVFLGQQTTVRQQVVFDGAPDEQTAVRFWLLTEPSAAPELTVRCERAGQVVVETRIALPQVDRAYHAVDGPWCDTHGQSVIAWSFEGHGVRLMLTAVDRVPGTLFVAGAARPQNDLVLQVRERNVGVDRYLPISRWAAGKPGVIGWPQIYLLLPYLYLVGVALLLRTAWRWRR